MISFGLLVLILVVRPAGSEGRMMWRLIVAIADRGAAGRRAMARRRRLSSSSASARFSSRPWRKSWNIIGGFTGYVSFGNSVFYGLGTYGTAIAMAQFHQPFWLGLVVGAVLAIVCALLLGIPILRLRGPYFAIATLGLSAAMGAVFRQSSR